MPYLRAAGEFKTKPTQHSTKELRSTGITPDVIICRSELPIDNHLKEKIAHFCDVDVKAVVNAPDAHSIYEVPLNLNRENVGDYILKRLKMEARKPDLYEWSRIVDSLKKDDFKVTVGIVGKYVELEDAYISIRESLKHD